MRISTSCPICIKDSRAESSELEELTPTYATTGQFIDFTCPKGHRTREYVSDPAFSLIFERALIRLADGQTRDAVIDASTAFDMYLASVPVRARYDQELGARPAEIRRQLRAVLGYATDAAALTAASLVSGKAPPDLKDWRTIRNAAVHQGVHPTIEQAENLCRRIDRHVIEFEAALGARICVNRVNYWTALLHEDTQAQPLPPSNVAVFSSVGCVLNVTGSVQPRPKLDDRLKDYRSGDYVNAFVVG